MPTGYTAKLYDGDQPFDDFVWGCARAFGALVLLRDDMSAPITDDRLVTNYYEKRVDECGAELVGWAASSDTSRHALFASWLATEERQRRERNDERIARKVRYQAMLDKARAWLPPTPEHAGLRKLMIEQLETSIDFDCSVYPTTPLPSFVEWCDERGEHLVKSLRRATEERKNERARNESRIAWVRALRESVPMPTQKGE